MLQGKRIIVTGYQTAIGKRAADILAENGAEVIQCSPGDTDETALTAAMGLLKTNRIIHGLCVIPEFWGKGVDAPDWRGEKAEEVFRVNVFAPLLFSRAIAGYMRERNVPGSIVFASDIVALDGDAKRIGYSAAMSALLGAMKSMAKAYGVNSIRLNAVASGIIQTSAEDGSGEAQLTDKTRLMDIKRLGREGDVVNTLLFLLSDLSSHITGQVMRVDGGMRCYC